MKRYRGHVTRELVTAIERAGGTVELTASGHLKVTGPDGITFLPSQDGSHKSHARSKTKLAREAGIQLAA